MLLYPKSAIGFVLFVAMVFTIRTHEWIEDNTVADATKLGWLAFVASALTVGGLAANFGFVATILNTLLIAVVCGFIIREQSPLENLWDNLQDLRDLLFWRNRK
jgi:hypothetical protein